MLPVVINAYVELQMRQNLNLLHKPVEMREEK